MSAAEKVMDLDHPWPWYDHNIKAYVKHCSQLGLVWYKRVSVPAVMQPNVWIEDTTVKNGVEYNDLDLNLMVLEVKALKFSIRLS